MRRLRALSFLSFQYINTILARPSVHLVIEEEEEEEDKHEIITRDFLSKLSKNESVACTKYYTEKKLGRQGETGLTP